MRLARRQPLTMLRRRAEGEKTMAFRLAAAAVLAWCALGGLAAAQTGSGMTMAEIGAVLERSGFPVEISKDGVGEPVIFSETSGLSFGLYQFACGSDGRCNEFLFSSVFELEPAMSLEKVNEYNRNAVAGRAFIDQNGEANIEHLFSVSGPEDADLVERNLVIWGGVLTDFAIFSGFWSAES